MKKFIAFCSIFLLLVVCLLSFVPRLSSVETIDQSSQFPAEVTARLTERTDGTPDLRYGPLQVVTVKNLWKSCQLYILPCYDFSTRDIGNFGQSSWSAGIDFIVLSSDENSLLARLVSVKAGDLSITVKPGENTSSISAGYSELLTRENNWQWKLTKPLDIAEDSELSASFNVLTTVSNSTPNQETSADCTWSYSLLFRGKPLGDTITFTVTMPYRVDCGGE